MKPHSTSLKLTLVLGTMLAGSIAFAQTPPPLPPMPDDAEQSQSDGARSDVLELPPLPEDGEVGDDAMLDELPPPPVMTDVPSGDLPPMVVPTADGVNEVPMDESVSTEIASEDAPDIDGSAELEPLLPPDETPPPPPAIPEEAVEAREKLPPLLLPHDDEDFFGALNWDEEKAKQEAEPEPEPEPVKKAPVKKASKPAPKKERVVTLPKEYRLPSNIYRKQYDVENLHLPVARYEGEYDEQLFLAAAHDRIEVVRSILDNTDRAFAMRNQKGDTLLLYAIRNGSQNTVRMLLGRGANPNDGNYKGVTALQYALLQNRADMAEVLLEKGADPNLPDYEGVTPLMLAATKKNPSYAKSLMKRGAAPNMPMANGRTPLHIAAEMNNANTLAALVRGGGDIHAADAKGNTPLILAAFSGADKAVTVALNAGADPNARDYLNRTALDMARARGHQGVTSQIMAAILRKEGWVSGQRPQVGTTSSM